MARSIPVRTGARKRAPSTSIRSYQSALAFLDSVANYEKMTRVGYNTSNFNLARMHRLLAAVDRLCGRSLFPGLCFRDLSGIVLMGNPPKGDSSNWGSSSVCTNRLYVSWFQKRYCCLAGLH